MTRKETAGWEEGTRGREKPEFQELYLKDAYDTPIPGVILEYPRSAW